MVLVYLPDIAHAEDTHDFAFWIVTSGDIVLPITSAEFENAMVEVTNGTDQEEDAYVRC